MARRVPKRFRRPVEREIAKSSLWDICCGVAGVLLIIVMVIGGISIVYDHLFFTHLSIYDDDIDTISNVPTNLESIDFPIKYKPNSTIYINAGGSSIIGEDYSFSDSVKTNSEGVAIYRYMLPTYDENINELFISFKAEDDDKVISYSIWYTIATDENLNNTKITLYDSFKAYETDSYQEVNAKLY